MRLTLIIILLWSLSANALELIPTSYESDPESANVCEQTISNDQIQEIFDAVDSAFEVTDTIERGEECQYFDSFKSQGVPENALKQSLHYYKKHKQKLKNKNYISIADYSQNSKLKRFFLLNMKTGKVESQKVSHGSGSLNGVKYADATIKNGRITRSTNHDGMLKRCRIPKDKIADKHDQWAMTRGGFFQTGSFYMSYSHNEATMGRKGWPTFVVNGKRYNGMRLVGLVDGVNDEALYQGVVMHEAYYNTSSVMGRSFGCPAFVPGEGLNTMKKISDGSLYYSYVPIEGCKSDYNKTLDEVKGWEKMCD